MAKLMTNNHKYGFVEGVLADTPSVDYNEKAQKLLQAEVVKLMHPKIAAIYADQTLAQILNGRYYSLHAYKNLLNCYLVGAIEEQVNKAIAGCHKTLQELDAAAGVQYRARYELAVKLREIIAPLTTVAAAHKALPEFAKYLPALAQKADRTVPVVETLSTIKLLKEAGWPK